MVGPSRSVAWSGCCFTISPKPPHVRRSGKTLAPDPVEHKVEEEAEGQVALLGIIPWQSNRQHFLKSHGAEMRVPFLKGLGVVPVTQDPEARPDNRIYFSEERATAAHFQLRSCFTGQTSSERLPTLFKVCRATHSLAECEPREAQERAAGT